MLMAEGFQLKSVAVADDSAAWRAAGFTVDDGRVRISNTSVLLDQSGSGRVVGLDIEGLSGPIDGLPVGRLDDASDPSPGGEHPNGVESIDHLVVVSPDSDRTTAALEAVGVEARRVTRFDVGGTDRRQTFFWLGDVILELVGPDHPDGDGPAVAWGLALTCADLEASAAFLGDACGGVKDAVQPGRRIATLRTRDLDISIAIALMSGYGE